MKLKVTFREYGPSETDEETGEKYRGEYLGSFEKEFEADTTLEIAGEADKFAEDYSEVNNVDCRVWEITLTLTPKGVQSN